MITKTTPKELAQFVSNWCDNQMTPEQQKQELLYCQEEDGRFTAVDNSTGDCWTEEFETEAEAIHWLDNPDEDATEKEES